MAQEAEHVEQQLRRARLAVDGLLERVAQLGAQVAHAERCVEQRNAELVRLLEDGSAPLLAALRERAEALEAEVALIAAGVAAGTESGAPHAPPAEQEPEPAGSGTEPAGSGAGPAGSCADPAAEPHDDPRPGPEPAEPGTGLAPSDLDDAAEQLEAGAPPPPQAAGGDGDGSGEDRPGTERARLLALNMALAGTPREEAERRLRDELDGDDPGAIVDEAYGQGGPG